MVVLVGMLTGTIVLRRHRSIVACRNWGCKIRSIHRAWVSVGNTCGHSTLGLTRSSTRLGRAHNDTIIGVCFDMFLQILRTFECFAAELAFVRLERDMNSNVRGDVVTFDSCGSALTPSAGQVEVVGGFSTDMSFAHVFLDEVVSLQVKGGRRLRNLRRELLLTNIAHRSPATDTASSHLRQRPRTGWVES